jgi:hypothetical protein
MRAVRWARVCVLHVVTLGLATSIVCAQTVFEDCDFTELRRAAPPIDARWLDIYPDSAYHRLIPALTQGRYAEIVQSVGHAIEGDAEVPVSIKLPFASQVAAASDQLSRTERSPSAVVNRARFDVDIDPDSPDRVTLFDGTKDSIAITAAISVQARRALCWRAILLRRVLVTQGDTVRRAALARLEEAEKHWDNYGHKGQSQFPWELALNSLAFDRTQLEPPRRQWILLHPSLGLELAGPRIGDLRRLEVLVLEPVGLVRYNSSYSSYLGASAVLTFPDDAKPGIGAMVHLGRLAKLGYVFRGRDGSGVRRNGILINVDLYRMLTGSPDKIQSAAINAVKQQEMGVNKD